MKVADVVPHVMTEFLPRFKTTATYWSCMNFGNFLLASLDPPARPPPGPGPRPPAPARVCSLTPGATAVQVPPGVQLLFVNLSGFGWAVISAYITD